MQKKQGEKVKYLLFLATLLMGISAHAQVVKCKDASGKVIYSDVACPTNFAGSSVNLSGGNFTEDQSRSAQARSTSNGDSGGEACPMLKERAEQAFTKFQGNSTRGLSNASFAALQNLATYCPSAGTCVLLKSSVEFEQVRYQRSSSSFVAASLDAALGLLAKHCQRGSGSQAQSGAGGQLVPPRDTQKPRGFYTNDEFGNLVRSDKCFMTKDTFGVSRRSAGCSK